ncbi:MAG: discoidin domain-containing protein [Gemmatimonadaceae bacterium]
MSAARVGSSTRAIGLLLMAMCIVSTGRAQDLASKRTDSAALAATVLDSFSNVGAWHATPADGVSLAISSDTGVHGTAMRLDFDFHGRAGYAVAHRALAADLPDNYEISFWIRGKAPSNNVEFKMLDASGENVWWVNRRDYLFPERWTRFIVKKRQVSFAWGPRGGGELRRLSAVELSITAGSGGKGSVWIDDLTLTPRERVPNNPPAPRAIASRSDTGSSAALAVDGTAATAWRTGSAAGASLALDLGYEREYGGLTVDWDPLDYAREYDVETSDDGRNWTTAYSVRRGHGGRDHLYMPETESRWVRLALIASSRGRGYAVREIAVKSLEWSASMNAFDFAIAGDAPRGDYPRAFTDSAQTYWTVIGAPAAEREALVSEDGAVEVGKGMFSLEPFLFVGGHLTSWADVRETQSLDRGDLPIPTVQWHPLSKSRNSLSLATTALVSGKADSAILLVRYRVTNEASSNRQTTLFVAVRPFQVNGPWQFLNGAGGAAPLRSLHYDGRIVRANGASGQTVVPVSRPDSFGAARFDAGGTLRALRQGSVPTAMTVNDSSGRADGALSYSLDVPARGYRDVIVAVPFGAVTPPASLSVAEASAYAEGQLARTENEWEESIGHVKMHLPSSADRLVRTLRTMQAYILINQDGPAIQPGSRSYERSWIRDGALTSEALLRTGHSDRVRAFLEWYAPYQYANGKVPCCVDRRGADPVPEHDSDGEFIYLVRQYYRFTRDTATLSRMWPHVAVAVAYLDSLRLSDRTPSFLAPAAREFYGVLPPSISHEGYSAKAMHSYWDDFWALRGFRDARAMAATLGMQDSARTISRIASQFNGDLLASISKSMTTHHIDFIPGSADLGDFDATSTTIALDPGGEAAALPHAALVRTFERYWTEHQNRVIGPGTEKWDAYTPYELRAVGAFVRLGRPERSHALLDFFLRGQRPAGWNEWAEVVRRLPRSPGFIGDMPHTWAGSDFIRSFLDLFVYERDRDAALVVGAGIPERWVRGNDKKRDSVSVQGLRTPYGVLDLSERMVDGRVHVELRGTMDTPPGGWIVHPPFPSTPISAVVNGARVATATDGSVPVRAVPATIEFLYSHAAAP